MDKILDKDGLIVHQYSGFGGIRRYVDHHLIKNLDISEVGDREGLLSILFDDGNSYQGNWASFQVLKNLIRYWNGVHGYDLTINGINAGIISRKNPYLSLRRL